MNTERLSNQPPPRGEPRPGAGLTVEISDTQDKLAVDAAAVRRLVVQALREQGVASAVVSVAIVDDAMIQEVNRRFLNHDWPTDVVTFPLSGPEEPQLCGELVVSAEMAARTALAAGVNPQDELALYVVHGLLHLCGHDDAQDEGRLAMRCREAEILALAGLPNTFAKVDGAGPSPIPPDAPQGRERARWTA